MSYCISRLILALYLFVNLVLPPIVGFFFLFHKRGRRRLLERFGFWNVASDEVLWFHGASVGEVQGLLPIIKECKKEVPELKILLTATSPTGLDAAKDIVDFKKLLTFDGRVWIWLATHKLKIKAFVFGETEIWPELLGYLSRKKIPVLLVNGRFSEKSACFWDRPCLREILSKNLQILDGIFAINEKYQKNFLKFGANSKTTIVNGNAKYDTSPSIASVSEAETLKKSFFLSDKPVFVVGSLRAGEEEVLFPALKNFKELNAISLVIAPRQQEKMKFFATYLQENGYSFEKRSVLKKSAATCCADILLLDTLGELEKIYSFADLALIGGTLCPKMGGHNPLEAAAYAVPIALGQSCENIDNIVDDLKDVGGVYQVFQSTDIIKLLQLVKDRSPALKEAGRAAQSIWLKNRGATVRIIDTLKEIFNK